MSFAAPIWLAVAAAVVAGVVIAHLFSTSVPQRAILPTVRFVPEGAPLAVMRTRRITDWLLLILRVVAVGLFGLALSGAHVPRTPPARVVLVDRSRAVASASELRDSARAAAAGGSARIVAFDSLAQRVTEDSLASVEPSGARGSLSAALVAAHRALIDITAGRNAVELVVVSPLVREETDSATSRLLALWEGPVRVVRVRAAAAPAAARVDVRALGDDPIASVMPSAASKRGSTPQASLRVRPTITSSANLPLGVRVVRTLPASADSAWAREGGALVLWPAENEAVVLQRRATRDTAGGVAAGSHVAIATFERSFIPRAGATLVRWIDGEPAATESALGRGCVREVAVPVDVVGDLALRESFRGIVQALIEPCGGARGFEHVTLSDAKGLQAAADSRSVGAPRLGMTNVGSLPAWLATAALALLVVEQLLRARRRTA